MVFNNDNGGGAMHLRAVLSTVLVAFFVILMIAPAFSQDMVDVLLTLEKINKRMAQLETTQKQDVQKLQNQIVNQVPGGAEQPNFMGSFDSLKTQVAELRQSMSNYAGLNGSVTTLASRFDGLEKDMAAVKTNPGNTGGSGMPPTLVAELQGLTDELKEAIKKQPPEPAKPGAPVAADKGALSKYDMKIYGFVKLEAMRDNTEVVKGDWLLYANKGGTPQSRQNIFTMNARQSRLGLKIGGPQVGTKGKINALFEVDFAGGFPNSATAARQPNLRLRNAWVELNYPKWEARFGQDWGLISGPFPKSSSFTVLGCAGNLWMNYPQASFTLKENPMKFAISINRPMAGDLKYDENASGDLDPVDNGERTAMPWLMSRAWFTAGKLTTSVSSHYGTKKINDLSAHSHTVKSYSANADVVFKIGHVSLTTRGFYGENLNSFLGGINQGYTTDSSSVKSITAAGGWGQVMYDFSDSWAATFGAGIDDPKNSDLTNGMRARNQVIYSNVAYKIQKAVEFVFETDYLKTYFVKARSGENWRTQFTSYFRF
jgi:hypothetical protein